MFLIDRKDIVKTSFEAHEDPIKYYYYPLLGNLYKKRLTAVEQQIKNEANFEKLLEIGYGSGIFLPTLKKYCASLYGLDLHPFNEKVKQSIIKYTGPDITLVKSDITKMPFDDNFFDCIAAVSILEHITVLKSSIDEIYRVLKPGGVFVTGSPVKNIFMNTVFKKVLRFDCTSKHPNDQKIITNTVSERFRIDKKDHFPRFLPLDLSFYFVLKARK